jgi:hypothetical protein
MLRKRAAATAWSTPNGSTASRRSNCFDCQWHCFANTHHLPDHRGSSAFLEPLQIARTDWQGHMAPARSRLHALPSHALTSCC